MTEIIMQNKKTIKKTGYTSMVYLTEELKELEADVFVNVQVMIENGKKVIKIYRG